jgi:hypothetical protein
LLRSDVSVEARLADGERGYCESATFYNSAP